MMRSLGLDGQRVPAVHVVQVFLHQDVAAAGEIRIGVVDQGEIQRFAPVGVFGAVGRSRPCCAGRNSEKCTSSTTVTAPPNCAITCVASSKQRSICSARIMQQQVARVAGARRSPALNSREGCSSAGRGWPNRRSQPAALKPIQGKDCRPARRRRAPGRPACRWGARTYRQLRCRRRRWRRGKWRCV